MDKNKENKMMGFNNVVKDATLEDVIMIRGVSLGGDSSTSNRGRPSHKTPFEFDPRISDSTKNSNNNAYDEIGFSENFKDKRSRIGSCRTGEAYKTYGQKQSETMTQAKMDVIRYEAHKKREARRMDELKSASNDRMALEDMRMIDIAMSDRSLVTPSKSSSDKEKGLRPLETNDRVLIDDNGVCFCRDCGYIYMRASAKGPHDRYHSDFVRDHGIINAPKKLSEAKQIEKIAKKLLLETDDIDTLAVAFYRYTTAKYMIYKISHLNPGKKMNMNTYLEYFEDTVIVNPEFKLSRIPNFSQKTLSEYAFCEENMDRANTIYDIDKELFGKFD